jgi:hypothetical protein
MYTRYFEKVSTALKVRSKVVQPAGWLWCIVILVAAMAIAGCGGGGPDVTAIARALIEEKATSISQTPGSCVATHNGNPIPDSHKWYPVSVATSHRSTYCPRNLQIVELRGWIHAIDTGCNPSDPDWHYALEVDSAWAVSQGIDLNQLFRVGNVYNTPFLPSNTGALERLVATPMIDVELWGWKPGDHPTQKPPADWGFSNVDTSAGCSDVLWPFNPVHPLAWQDTLKDGQYVRMVGSLVTDSPHESEAGIPTWFCRNFGILCGAQAKLNSLKMNWGEGRNETADDPARWTEIHPPDLIAIRLDPGHKETLREVAVLAEHCLIGRCASQTIDEDIAPPACVQHHRTSVTRNSLEWLQARPT